jgi:hypothetical protein
MGRSSSSMWRRSFGFHAGINRQCLDPSFAPPRLLNSQRTGILRLARRRPQSSQPPNQSGRKSLPRARSRLETAGSKSSAAWRLTMASAWGWRQPQHQLACRAEDTLRLRAAADLEGHSPLRVRVIPFNSDMLRRSHSLTVSAGMTRGATSRTLSSPIARDPLLRGNHANATIFPRRAAGVRHSPWCGR